MSHFVDLVAEWRSFYLFSAENLVLWKICCTFAAQIGINPPLIYFQRRKLGGTKQNKMKEGLHPENYRPVVFKDMSNGDMFLSRSTAKTNDTIEFEGETYPLYKLEISNTSHPFYTGKNKLVDTAGRVDKFMSRYSRSKK